MGDDLSATLPKNYVYRMDHDTGYAPHISGKYCILCGCKKTTVERWAKEGSWVIGIGGIHTGQRDKLIYAMKVTENPNVRQFRRKYPRESNYLVRGYIGDYALVSREFFYFGNHAIELDGDLEHIIIDRQGCKCISNEDVDVLLKFLSTKRNKTENASPNNVDERPRATCRT